MKFSDQKFIVNMVDECVIRFGLDDKVASTFSDKPLFTQLIDGFFMPKFVAKKSHKEAEDIINKFNDIEFWRNHNLLKMKSIYNSDINKPIIDKAIGIFEFLSNESKKLEVNQPDHALDIEKMLAATMHLDLNNAILAFSIPEASESFPIGKEILEGNLSADLPLLGDNDMPVMKAMFSAAIQHGLDVADESEIFDEIEYVQNLSNDELAGQIGKVQLFLENKITEIHGSFNNPQISIALEASKTYINLVSKSELIDLVKRFHGGEVKNNGDLMSLTLIALIVHIKDGKFDNGGFFKSTGWMNLLSSGGLSYLDYGLKQFISSVAEKIDMERLDKFAHGDSQEDDIKNIVPEKVLIETLSRTQIVHTHMGFLAGFILGKEKKRDFLEKFGKEIWVTSQKEDTESHDHNVKRGELYTACEKMAMKYWNNGGTMYGSDVKITLKICIKDQDAPLSPKNIRAIINPIARMKKYNKLAVNAKQKFRHTDMKEYKEKYSIYSSEFKEIEKKEMLKNFKQYMQKDREGTQMLEKYCEIKLSNS
jgi:hypothetical protein